MADQSNNDPPAPASSPTFTYRALLIGLSATFFMGLWIHFHEVLVRNGNILAENSPPASAVGLLVVILLVIGGLSKLSRAMRLARGELVVIYTMLILSAPIMSQGMWHRFLGLMIAVPSSTDNLPLLDSFSDKLWPHGPQLVADPRFEQGLGSGVVVSHPDRVRMIDVPSSQVGATRGIEVAGTEETTTKDGVETLVETTVRIRVPRRGATPDAALVPGEKYFIAALVKAEKFSPRTAMTVEFQTDKGQPVAVSSVRRDTQEVYSRPGGFQRIGQPFVVVSRDLEEYGEIIFTMTGTGTATIADVSMVSNEPISRLLKGQTQISAADLDKLPDNARDGLIVRPDDPAGSLWFTVRGYIPYRAWLTPAFYWSSIVLAIFLGLLGISVILRKQWADNERFSFPMIVLPKLLIDEATADGVTHRPIFRSSAFRWGVGFAFVYALLQGLAYYVPGLPNPTVNVNLGDYFASPAMKAFVKGMYTPDFTIVLLFMSIAFFIDLDMLLSILVFFLLSKVPYYLGEVFGWKNITGPMGNFPFSQEQHIGSFLSLSLIVLWASRKHLRAVGRRVLGMEGGADDSQEAMSYRTAVLLVVGAFVYFAVWGNLTGLGAKSAMFFFGFLVVCGLSASRIRTEAGLPSTYFTPYYPSLIFFLLGGLYVFGTQTLLLAYAAGGFMAVAQFLLFAPSQVEVMQLAQSQNARPRQMPAVLVVGVLLGVFLGGYYMLSWGYGRGGENVLSSWSLGQNWYFNSLRSAVVAADQDTLKNGVANVSPTFPVAPLTAVGVGAAITLTLTVLRTIFVGFWLHPIGYILANTYFIYGCWGSLLAAWVVKWLALKIGGPRIIRERMTPFFAGVFVGCVAGMFLWDVVALVNMSRGVRDVFSCLP